MRVALLATYELGRQPFGLASPAAWLRAAGHHVTVADLACSPIPWPEVEQAELIAFHIPMHTATRLFLRVVERVQRANPWAHFCAYGLYAPLNAPMLRRIGVHSILGGEFEQRLLELASGACGDGMVSLERQKFQVPDRTGLPPLEAYAQLMTEGGPRLVGYTESSRGCLHFCRHCPITPVYRGAFRVVQRDVVLEDIRGQIDAGARHITFGDPDFFNGPAHGIQIVEEMHRHWPEVSYDVTIKIEHLLRRRDLLPVLAATGCAFVTSAVESMEDTVLERLRKGHTRADFLEALRLMRSAGLPLSPTFLPFTPWTTLGSYRQFLQELAGLGLAGQVPSIQFGIRLLIPAGSAMLELPEIRACIEPFDPRGLCYPWHGAPEVDALCVSIQETVKRAERKREPREQIFRRIWDLAGAGAFPDIPLADRATIPYLTEPWYC